MLPLPQCIALFAFCYVNLGRDLSTSWVRYATAKVAYPAIGGII